MGANYAKADKNTATLNMLLQGDYRWANRKIWTWNNGTKWMCTNIISPMVFNGLGQKFFQQL